jgi:hypothetical protein
MRSVFMTNLYFDLSSSEYDSIKKMEAASGGKLMGRFGLKNVSNWFNLLELTDFDKKIVKGVPVKSGEMILRYATITTSASGCFPLIKINLERRLVYFLKPDAFNLGHVDFETRGVKAHWITL